MAVLDHVGVTVSDPDATARFLATVADAREVLRTRSGGPWFDALTGAAGARLEVVMVALGDVTVQLVGYASGGGDRLALAHAAVGTPHLSVQVTDVEARHARLAAEGAFAVSPLVSIPGTGRRSFYVTGPDGLPVELIDPPPLSG